MSSQTIATPNHVVSTEFQGGEGVLVDLNTKRYYQLNETAMLVWRGLEAGKSVDELRDQMVLEYDVSVEQANASVHRLLSDLQSRRLLPGD
jgi:hypothetical protein